MVNRLYGIAVVLLIIWGIAFIRYNAGGIIHVLLIIAFALVILRISEGKKRF